MIRTGPVVFRLQIVTSVWYLDYAFIPIKCVLLVRWDNQAFSRSGDLGLQNAFTAAIKIQIMESFATLPEVSGVSLGMMLALPWWSGEQNAAREAHTHIYSSLAGMKHRFIEKKTEILQRRGSGPTTTSEDPCLESKRSCDAHSLISDSNDSSFGGSSVSLNTPLSLCHSCKSASAGPSSTHCSSRPYWLQKENTPSVNKFKSHIEYKVVDVQLWGAPGCGPHPCRGGKGVYSHYMLPPLPLWLLDNCNLPQSDSANRWPWRPTGRSCSLSMSPLSQIHTAFILTTVCGGAVIFFLHFIQLHSNYVHESFFLCRRVKHTHPHCVKCANTSTSTFTKLKFGKVWYLEFLGFWM